VFHITFDVSLVTVCETILKLPFLVMLH